MGHKISVVRGVKSDHFYNQQNGINEIWVGDVEVISRLPFGDSDQEQSSWPPGGVPKIPWHHFIIPLHKRDELGTMAAQTVSGDYLVCTCDKPLPMAGYAGMYSGLHPRLTELLGGSFLFVTVAMCHLFYISAFNFARLSTAISVACGKEKGREESTPPDPSVDEDCPVLDVDAILRDMTSQCLFCGFTILGAILCLIMGLPAIAAGSGNAKAVEYIISNGLSIGSAHTMAMAVWFAVMAGRLVYLYRVLETKVARDPLILFRAFTVLFPWLKASAQTQPV